MLRHGRSGSQQQRVDALVLRSVSDGKISELLYEVDSFCAIGFGGEEAPEDEDSEDAVLDCIANRANKSGCPNPPLATVGFTDKSNHPTSISCAGMA